MSNVKVLHKFPKRRIPKTPDLVSLEVTAASPAVKLSRKWRLNTCPRSLVEEAQELHSQ